MKKKNMGINAILNVIKSGLSVLFPLITYPYALRVIGIEGIGKVTYGNSILSYFSLLAALGISTYAVREGAKKKHDKNELNEFVNEVFTINICTTIITYILLVIVLISVGKLADYRKLILLQSASIILTTVGMDWINTIYEDFFLITVRSIITHIISMILLFIFVRSPQDYYIYAFLSVLTNGIVCISNIFYVRKYVKPRITFHPNFKKHMKPLLLMFSNTLAISIYVNFDTTMLGWLKGDYAVGLYAVAVKIYTIIKQMMQAIYVVAIPRLASYIGKKDEEQYKNVYTKLWEYLSLILIPSGIGLMCVSQEVIIFMGGKQFVQASLALQILSMSLIFAIYGGLVTAVLNITLGREKDNLIATVWSAVINCGLNFVFIPLLSQNGAAITTLISEMFVFIFCLIRIPNKRRYMDYSLVKRSIRDSLLGGVGIIACTIIVKNLITNIYIRSGVIIISSVVIYTGIVLILKNPSAMAGLDVCRKRIKNLTERKV